MLAIRMQRLGRKGHPTYRVVVQDSRQAPTSGKVVAMLGSYDPHTKKSTLVKDKAEFYLSNGAQPSPRVVSLFKTEKVKMPDWVDTEKGTKKRDIKNPEKLRKNQPADEVAEEPKPEASATEAASTEEADSKDSAESAEEKTAESTEAEEK